MLIFVSSILGTEVKKINLLKLCKIMFISFIVLFMVFFCIAYFLKIDARDHVKGIIKNENGKKIVVVQVLEQSMEQIAPDQKVVLESELCKLEGVVIQVEQYDIGISEGRITRYEIEIITQDLPLDENCYYDFQLYNMKKYSLLSYIYKNI